jgi:hypothetical protein
MRQDMRKRESKKKKYLKCKNSIAEIKVSLEML